jgi:hypothetical protein
MVYAGATRALTKRWSEPPPGAKFIFQMTKTLSVEAALAFGGGRSVFSR